MNFKKQSKFFHNFFATTSVLAILAGGVVTVFGVELESSGNIQLSVPGNTQLSGTMTPQNFSSGDSLDVTGNHAIDADVNAFGIQAIRLSAAPGIMTINNNTLLGSVQTATANPPIGPFSLDINFAGVHTLTLTGSSSGNFAAGQPQAVAANHYNIGAINFAAQVGATLDANGGIITGNVDSIGGVGGVLNFGGVGATGVTGTIGAANALALVHFNAGGNNIALGGNAVATDFTYGAADIVTAVGAIIGDVDFNGHVDAILNAEGNITGNVDSTGGVGGVLNFAAVGPQTVTGTIGAANALALVHFNAGGNNIALGGNAVATDFTYGAADIVTAVGAITGNVDFNGHAAVLHANGGVITGNVDSRGGVGGTLIFGGVGATGVTGVTGTIGAANALTLVHFNAGGNNIALGGNAVATDFTYGAADIVTARGTIIGDVDFNGHAAILDANGGVITGNVDSTGGVGGTLIFGGVGATGVTGVTGTIGTANALTLVHFNAGGNDIALGGNAVATDFTYGAADTVTAVGAITGNVDFNGHAGAILDANGGVITGNVDSTGGVGGTLIFGGVGATGVTGVTGTIGAANALTLVHFNAGGNNIALGGNAVATDFTYGAADIVTAVGAITGNVDFNGHAGAILDANGGVITGNVDSRGGVGGTLIFGGVGATGVTGVTGTIGAANALTLVHFNAGGNNIALGGNAVATDFTYGAADIVTARGTIIGDVDFNGHAAILDANGGVITGNVDSTGGVGGTLIFGGVGATGVTGVTGTIGAANALTLVHFNAGGNNIALGGNAVATDFTYGVADIVTARGTIIGDVDFNGHAGAILNANGGVITGNVDSTGGVGGVLNFGGVGAQTVTGVIGGTNRLLAINIAPGATVNLPNAIVRSQMINIGTIAGAGTLIRGGIIDFDINNAVTHETMIGFAHADSVLKLQNTNNAADSTITLQGNLAGLADNNGKLQLTSSGGGHQLIIARNAAETIGTAANNRIKELIVDGTQNTEINPEVFAKAVTLETTGAVNFAGGLDTGAGGTINVGGNTILQGDIDNTGGDITINLGRNTLTYNNGGTATLVGAVTINTIINPGVGIGNIIVDGVGTTLDLEAATGVIINLNGTSDLGDVGKTYKLLSVTNGGAFTPSPAASTFNDYETSELGIAWKYKDGAIYNLPGDDTLDRLNSNNTNAYVYYAFRNGHIVTVSRLKEGLTEDFGQTNPGIVTALADIDITQDTDARDLANSFGNMSNTDHVRQQEVADRLSVVAPTEAVGSVVTEVVQAAQNSIAIRMGNFSGVATTVAVASGDESIVKHYGIWGSPFYGQATQKKKGSAPGYKGKYGGGTIGFDCLVNDDLTLGMALTAVNTKINHKNQKAGDTTKVKSRLFSIYGIQQLPDNWFVQAIASYGSSKVRNYEKRIINLTLDQTALGKYTSTSYSGEVLAGYKYVISDNQVTLTPMLGLRYAKVKDGGYTETGTSRRNMTVGKKSVEKVEVVAGGRASFVSQLKDDMLLMPEVHGFINYDLKKAKAPSVDARLNGALVSMPVKIAEPERAFYNLGAGLTIKHQIMEYGLGYDAYLAKKYVSNQGSIKVRVNF